MKLQEARYDVIQIVERVLRLCKSQRQIAQFRNSDTSAIGDTLTDGACALRLKIAQSAKSPHTIKNWISKLRNMFREMMHANDFQISHGDIRRMVMVFNRSMVMPEEISAQVEARATERRDERATTCVSMKFAQADEIIRKIGEIVVRQYEPVGGYVRGRDDGLIAPVAVYVGLVTGRRPIEWESKHFHVRSVTGTPATVFFSGQAKTRKEGEKVWSVSEIARMGASLPAPDKTKTVNVCGPSAPYEIPVLDNPVGLMGKIMILDGYGKRRFGQQHYEEIGRRIGWPLGSMDLMPNTMRAFYACYCSAKYRDESEQDWRYIGRILGHTEDDMVTCQAYKRFAIS